MSFSTTFDPLAPLIVLNADVQWPLHNDDNSELYKDTNDGLESPHSQINNNNLSGPTAAQIVANRDANNIFQRAWADSFNTRTTAQEIGGWIYADRANPSRIFFRPAPRNRSTPMSQLNPPPQLVAGIDLNNPGGSPGNPPPRNFVLVANFHTHPMGPAYGSNSAFPSTADHVNAWGRGVPGIIISRIGTRAYGPERRESLNGPIDYPNPNLSWSGQNAQGTRVGTWTPTRVPNQQE